MTLHQVQQHTSPGCMLSLAHQVAELPYYTSALFPSSWSQWSLNIRNRECTQPLVASGLPHWSSPAPPFQVALSLCSTTAVPLTGSAEPAWQLLLTAAWLWQPAVPLGTGTLMAAPASDENLR